MDGNLAALNTYLAELDAADRHDEMINQERLDKADGMFDDYFIGDDEAVSELHYYIMDDLNRVEKLLDLMRSTMYKESEYREFILEMCCGYHGAEL